MTIQVLRERDIPQRAIARQLGVSEGAVRYQVRRRREGAQDGRRKAMRAEEVAEAVAAWHAARAEGSRPVNVQELWEHLVAVHGYEGSYKSVQRFVRRTYGRPPMRTYRRVETPPGAQAQTDWGEWSAVDLGDGPVPLSAFVMSLSWSRRPAVIWSERKDLVSWLFCHNEAFRRLGGIPAVNRIDNVKTAISRGAGAWGEIHPTYRAYSRSVGFHIDACQPREPQAKGKIEAKVRLGRLILDPTRRPYAGLADLQAETDEEIERWMRRAKCPATGTRVEEAWLEERELLAPLPLLPEPFDVVVSREVRPDCMVAFEGRWYAVPFRFAGRMVEVRGCAGLVQIVHGGAVVQEHPRGTARRILIDPACYEGESTQDVLAPAPLGRMGRKLAEIYAMPVEQRPLDLYAALAEVAR